MQKEKKPFPWFVVSVYVLALLVRLAPVIAARELTIGLDDMFQYDMLARSIAAGQGFRWYGQEDLALVERYFPIEFVTGEYDPRGVLTSFRAPGYPMFLSLIYLIVPLAQRFFAARLVQAGIGAFLAPMTYALARRVFPGKEKLARISAVILALYPMLVVFPLALATETIFVPLVLGGTLALLKAGETHRTSDYVLAGVMFGAAALTRSVIAAILPFLMLWAWFMAKDKKGALILLAGVLVFTVPWSVRNSRLHGQFTFVENAMGYTLYMGYHPDTDGKFIYGPSVDLMPYLDDGERNQVGMEKAIGFIKDDPGRIPYLMVRKLGYFLGLERRALTYFYSNNFVGQVPQPYFTLLFIVFTLPFAVVTSSAALALPFLPWKKESILVGVVCLAYIAPHTLLLAEDRFHLAIVPFLTVFAAYTWTHFSELLAQMRQKSNRWKLALALVLLVLLWFNWGFELWQDADKLAILFGPQGNQSYFSY